MNAPKTRDPLAVTTSDGSTWVRRAVTHDGRGLYALEGVCDCPEYLMASLAELAEHGVQGRGESVAEVVARVGALPAPISSPAPAAELSMPQIEALVDAGNRAVNDYYHERACSCDLWPTTCHTNPAYAKGYWDTDAFGIGAPAVVALWEVLRNDRHVAKVAELRARVAELEAELEADTGTVDDDPIALVLTHCARCGEGLDDESISDFCSDRCESASKLATLLARQREDEHTSPLHHEYRIGRDLEVQP